MGDKHTPWALVNEAELASVEELESQSDRGVAIMGGAFVEERVRQAILHRLRPLSKTMRDRLFNGDRPLSSFSAKIDLGFALGLYGPVTRADLDRVRRVRNIFAHSLAPCDFSRADIEDLVTKICLPERIKKVEGDPHYSYKIIGPIPLEPKPRMILSIKLFLAYLYSESVSTIHPNPTKYGQPPNPMWLKWLCTITNRS
jgi:hypothetical protein